jgi:hypothetical protein
VQAGEVVIDVEGRTKDSNIDVVKNIAESMKSDNDVEFQQLGGIRTLAGTHTVQRYLTQPVAALSARPGWTAPRRQGLSGGGLSAASQARTSSPSASRRGGERR